MTVRNDFKPGEFCWIDLNAHDLDAAVRWYGDLFGWANMRMPGPPGAPPYAFFQKGEGTVGGVGQMSEEMKAQGIPPMWNTYVSTNDCEATEAGVEKHGGTVTVSTMEIPGHGKLMFFMDPGGASVAAWQSIGDDGRGVVVREHGSLGWNELMTRDMDQAKTFYGELFGWDFTPMPMDGVPYEVLRGHGTDLGGMMPLEGEKFEGVPPHWLVYFQVDDCNEIVEKVEATGGAVRVPVTEIPVGEFAVVADPQGAVFSVVRTTSS